MSLIKLSEKLIKCPKCGESPCECKEEEREVKDFKIIKSVINRELEDHRKYESK